MTKDHRTAWGREFDARREASSKLTEAQLALKYEQDRHKETQRKLEETVELARQMEIDAQGQVAMLAAQVEAYRTYLLGLHRIDFTTVPDAVKMLTSTPQQCLRDVEAEAVLKAVKFFAPARDIDVEALESYAERVRNEH